MLSRSDLLPAGRLTNLFIDVIQLISITNHIRAPRDCGLGRPSVRPLVRPSIRQP